jgi:site-specific DNA-methyltransferase (adenine-specific)
MSKILDLTDLLYDSDELISATTADYYYVGSAHIELADAGAKYEHWPAPTVIVSDGAYGVGGFPGDPPTPEGLAEWYAPHAAAWARYALPETTLWFWGTEVGWATVHPVLVLNGWEYRALHIWDKSVAHVAGNCNSKTIRRFPVVTEVCAQYVRLVKLLTPDGQSLPIREWLRAEWFRAGLPLSKTNEACGVKNAATRKYFTQDHLWYFPPPEMMEKIAAYANKHGKTTEWPYFSIDGRAAVTSGQWERMRAKWNYIHGITNVWTEPAVRGSERLKDSKSRVLHSNQKPLKLIERLILASSDPKDVVWEPFGGLCSAAVAALRTGRICYSAEINTDYYHLAKVRLERERQNVTAYAAR